MRAFFANGWRSLMPRLGVARGAVMGRGAEVLRCRTGDAACMAGQARASHARGARAVAQKRMEARVLLGRGEAGAARGASAVAAASAVDRGKGCGRHSRPHQLDVRL